MEENYTNNFEPMDQQMGFELPRESRGNGIGLKEVGTGAAAVALLVAAGFGVYSGVRWMIKDGIDIGKAVYKKVKEVKAAQGSKEGDLPEAEEVKEEK